MNSVIEKLNDANLLGSLYQMLEVEAAGDATIPIQGQTSVNFLQETNKGLLLLRFNPISKEKLETGHALFEIESLCFFTRNGIPVPKLLKFKDKFYFKTDRWIICAYFCLSGVPIQRSELSVDLGSKIGKFLSKVIEVSVTYSSKNVSGEPFINSFHYIFEIASKIENMFPKLKKFELWNTMKITTKTNQDILKDTPRGIVHADYFYENILKDKNDNIVGLIDFGDAYYGHNLHDIAIGAMECCILEGENWNLEIFNAFLKAISPILICNFISFKQFYETLKVNCFRFGLYTLSNTLTHELSLNCNIYINRYEKLMSKSFEDELFKIYSEIFAYETIADKE